MMFYDTIRIIGIISFYSIPKTGGEMTNIAVPMPYRSERTPTNMSPKAKPSTSFSRVIIDTAVPRGGLPGSWPGNSEGRQCLWGGRKAGGR